MSAYGQGFVDGNNGFELNEDFGVASLRTDVAGAGDVNGDLIDDFVVSYADNASFGNTGLFLGATSTPGFYPAYITPDNYVRFNVGGKVSGIGDINNDGFYDFIVSSARVAFGPNRPTRWRRRLVVFGIDGPDIAPTSSLELLTTPDRIDAGDYGWVIFKDGTKQWVDPTCRGSLETFGVLTTAESWAAISLYPDGSPKSCDAIIALTGSSLTVLVTPDRTAPGNYGWVVFSDGTKQWLPGQYRDELEARGIIVAARPWTEISMIADSDIIRSCAELKALP